MINERDFENILEVYVITYNRDFLLDRTLENLVNSLPKYILITVIDNKSVDNTSNVVIKYIQQGHKIKYVINNINIGSSANVLRCFEYSQSKYTWILGDDDEYDLKGCNLEFINKLKTSEINLIHVGAHGDDWNYAGIVDTPNNLIAKGYEFFKFGSFLGCNIFKTERFVNGYIEKGYANSVNCYPHMPYLFDVYYEKAAVLINKDKFVKAIWKHQNYTTNDWFQWWLGNAISVGKISDMRIVFLNHFNNTLTDDVIWNLKVLSNNKIFNWKVKFVVNEVFTFSERIRYRTYNFRQLRKYNGRKWFLINIKKKLLKFSRKVLHIFKKLI